MLETRLSLRSLLTGAVTPLWQLVTQLLRFADAAAHLPTAVQSSSSPSPAGPNLYTRLYRTHMFDDLMRQVCYASNFAIVAPYTLTIIIQFVLRVLIQCFLPGAVQPTI